jgi:raffinose synthase
VLPHNSDAVLVGAGDDPFQLVNDAVIAAASLSGGAPALQEKRIPASVDVFGWCTWDAFYHSVSAKGDWM